MNVIRNARGEIVKRTIRTQRVDPETGETGEDFDLEIPEVLVTVGDGPMLENGIEVDVSEEAYRAGAGAGAARDNHVGRALIERDIVGHGELRYWRYGGLAAQRSATHRCDRRPPGQRRG